MSAPSKEQHNQDHDGHHEGPIKTVKQLVVVVLLSFLIPIFGIWGIAHYISISAEAEQAEAVNAKPSPAAAQAVSEVASQATPTAAKASATAEPASTPASAATADVKAQSGEEVYNNLCISCHAAGVAGAPKMGDQTAWASKIAEGEDAMIKAAIAGKGAMPAKGGNPDLSDLEVARAVVFMANKSGAQFEEPTQK